MAIMNSFRGVVQKPVDLVRRLATEKRGVAAIEFALIAPLLLAMYFVTMEIAPAIDSSKKVGRGASMIADLVSQQQTVTRADLDAIMRLGEATILPYNRSRLKVFVTGIDVDKDGNPTVLWSRQMVEGAFSEYLASGTAVVIPADLKVANSFYVKVETNLHYEPMIFWNADANAKSSAGLLATFDNINMKEAYYLRPRVTAKVNCSNC
jgi:Flp pilus assembly protein TadG